MAASAPYLTLEEFTRDFENAKPANEYGFGKAIQKIADTPYPTKPVDLCIEILSPGDALRTAFSKGAHYIDRHIGRVCTIDEQHRRAWWISLDSPKPTLVQADGTLPAGRDKPIEISLTELFDELDRLLPAEA